MKTVLLKLSGKILDDLFVNDKWIKAIRELKDSFEAVVIVHGGGKKISEWCKVMDIEPKFFNGQRVTDRDTMDIVAAVQAGLLNAKLVSRLQTEQINAVGLTGIDNGLFTTEYLNENLGYVGIPIFTGKKELLDSILGKGIIPVFSSLGRDNVGNLVNINADIFSKELALAINADIVLFLTDIKGVKMNGKLQTVISETEFDEGIINGEITDGMIPKLQCCFELMKKSIDKVWIGNELPDLTNDDTIFESKLKGTWIASAKPVTA